MFNITAEQLLGSRDKQNWDYCDSFTVYTRVQVERVYKSNPIFEAKNTTFLEKVWFFSFHQLNRINRWSGIQG